MAICAVIFDLDGVLIDSAEAHKKSWQLLGQEHDLVITDPQFAATFGRRNRDIVSILFGDDLAAEKVRTLSHRKEELYRDIVRGAMPVADGAVELIHYYHEQGFKLAIGVVHAA